MNIEMIREFCLALPGVTEDIKWGNNLVFSVGGKMFCLADLEVPLRVSFKVEEEQFLAMTALTGVIQAPYFARMKWVCVTEPDRFSTGEWEQFLLRAYHLIKNKLPAKIRESLS